MKTYSEEEARALVAAEREEIAHYVATYEPDREAYVMLGPRAFDSERACIATAIRARGNKAVETTSDGYSSEYVAAMHEEVFGKPAAHADSPTAGDFDDWETAPQHSEKSLRVDKMRLQAQHLRMASMNDELREANERLTRERNEARAGVERLKAVMDDSEYPLEGSEPTHARIRHLEKDREHCRRQAIKAKRQRDGLKAVLAGLKSNGNFADLEPADLDDLIDEALARFGGEP